MSKCENITNSAAFLHETLVTLKKVIWDQRQLNVHVLKAVARKSL